MDHDERESKSPRARATTLALILAEGSFASQRLELGGAGMNISACIWTVEKSYDVRKSRSAYARWGEAQFF